ncbi:conserved hypothetical protein [Streptomyces pristinaespiralis ATCC 25486]|uniref:SPW_0924 family protein n=2 Tax=Streptomyces pristinaespiralis TaxID=38300 RepID=B5HG70_STRE2|nr:conserved hypothetical protein [Streptomyces pristinaespiralis ATCC 25486]
MLCVLFFRRRCYGAPDLTTYQIMSGRPSMRALVAAAVGLAAALALVLTVTAIGTPPGETSPEPLLTTVPGPKD